MKGIIAGVLVLAAMLQGGAGPARAETISYIINGAVEGWGSPGSFTFGDTVQFQITLDPATLHAPTHKIAQVSGQFSNGLAVTGLPGDELVVEVGTDTTDGGVLFKGAVTGSPTPGGLLPQYLQILVNVPAYSFVSDAANGYQIPDIPGLLTLAKLQSFSVSYAGFGNSVFGRITDISMSVVTTPIPAALPLFVSALAGLGFTGWRRRRAKGAASCI